MIASMAWTRVMPREFLLAVDSNLSIAVRKMPQGESTPAYAASA